MASWIKVQVTLPESPKVFRLARLLGVCRMEALGYAVRWFCWVDSHCAEGSTGLTEVEVDALLGKDGVTGAFCELGWTAVDAAGYVLVLDFDKHNGEGAKRRAEVQLRVAAHRERQAAGGGLSEPKDSCNAKSVTIALPDKNIYIDNNMGVGKAVLYREAAADPAPPQRKDGLVQDEVFREWLSGLCKVHPSASKSLYLAPDVLRAAKDAFGRCPGAVDAAGLLGAYYADKRLADHGFYAPRGQRRFFDDLEDVLAHAERWRKWAGWKPSKKVSAAAKAPAGQANGEKAPVMTDEARAAFFRELRKGGEE